MTNWLALDGALPLAGLVNKYRPQPVDSLQEACSKRVSAWHYSIKTNVACR